jgi:5'/3'-nucleotidase SurE
VSFNDGKSVQLRLCKSGISWAILGPLVNSQFQINGRKKSVLQKLLRPVTLLSAALTLISTPAWPLDILVANDDSCNAEGINVLMDTLEAAGHNVTMYAPAGEQSSKSSSIYTEDIGVTYDISNAGFEGPTGAANRYCIRIPILNPEEGSEGQIIASATPFDSVQVGLAAMAVNPPDIVISGINSSQNIGNRAINSGTVGAALSAMRQGVPAIALSRHYNGSSYQPAADFVVSVLAQLESGRAEGEPLLPSRTGLNINVPPGPARGVVYTTLGTASDLTLRHEATDDGVQLLFDDFIFLADLVGEEAAEELGNNPDATLEDFAEAGLDLEDETSMFVAGYITVTTLDGDLTAKRRKRELMQVKLRDLQ